MGCNCGKGKKSGTKRGGGHSSQDEGQTQTFRLEMPNGQSFVYGSRLEAEAARVRHRKLWASHLDSPVTRFRSC